MGEAPACLVNRRHPLAAAAEAAAGGGTVAVGDDGSLPEGAGLRRGSRVVDLTLLRTPEKRRLLGELGRLGAEVASDLSVNWGEALRREFPCLRASMALAFHSPTRAFEFHCEDPAALAPLWGFLGSLGLTGVPVSGPGVGFHFPRTLAMVANEAFFALEDGLASREDIDAAMRHGVNHPLGPFEWTERTGAHVVVDLLDELHAVLGDPRYRASRLLRLEALGEAG